MSQSHTIQRYSEFLSRPTSTIGEKYLTKSEVSRLITHTEMQSENFSVIIREVVKISLMQKKSFNGFKM